ncbi:LysE family translocator [Lichenihabitans sp. PAMC28606]|uniref:LysE family translocator n=1 Tax=Lichenihabitans sp. PAMC28606 TaxID=2880932 RepID=UPI001D09D5D0|nr:LysE family translocator [Lichenihabitans sp. PAMC28606]UDL93559.1 LysE family translocator [Lichenihabitans sp. PAMC28606]
MLALLPALALFGIVMSITPGPNNVMLMASGVNFGFRRTLPHMSGVTIGFGVMAALVGLGLAGLFTAMPVLFVILKWVGAVYLLVLAIRIARSATIGEAAAGRGPMTFFHAAAFQWVNPKAWIIVISACATYAVPGHYTASIMLVALVLGTVTFPCVSVWVLFGAGLRRALSDPYKLRLFNWSMAGLLLLSLIPVVLE